MSVIYPENFEAKIGFDVIRQMLLGKCLSSLGKDYVHQISFQTKYKTIEYLTNLVVEFQGIILQNESLETNYIIDLRQPLLQLKTEGSHIEQSELFDLKRSLESTIKMIRFFHSKQGENYPLLKQKTEPLFDMSSVLARIDGIIDSKGIIKDNASPELKGIRSELRSLSGAIGRKMQSILRALQSDGIVEDVSISIRDGRPVIPVAASNKRKVKGIIHDESATGKTSFIEPSEIVEMNNRLRVMESAERREILKILTTFSDELRPHIDELLQVYDFLGEIDFIQAKAKLAIEYECIKPEIKDEPFFEWMHAKHPVLTRTLRKEKREVIPLTVRLFEPNRIILISGPNAGGKSVCLKTVGIVQYMLQCGLLVPMTDGSKMGVFKKLFIDIGDEQSLENDLSTYSSHLLNMKHFLKFSNNQTMVLIDEFGTGTEPMLGGAIAESVLDQLNKKGVYGVITTHYTSLKHFASSQEGIINGAMLYDNVHMKPLFQLSIGKPGSSFAFEIARKIGLPESILQDASTKIGKDHIDFDKHLREIIRDKQYWETKRTKIRKVEKQLDVMSDEVKTELTETDKLRKQIISQAKKEAQQILNEANKRIENTIREIRESQAEKEKTKDIRKKLVEYRETVDEIDSESEERINSKIKKLQQRDKNRNKKVKKPKVQTHTPSTLKTKIVFAPGDKVRLIEQNALAEIIDIDSSKVVVALGHIMITTTRDKIEAISKNQVKKEQKTPKKDSLKITNKIMEKKLHFKPEIDVRGMRAEEAMQKIREFIDEAVMVQCHKVKILHGKGYGVLKEVIRNFLKTDPIVKSYRDEHIQFGGSGITIVELD